MSDVLIKEKTILIIWSNRETPMRKGGVSGETIMMKRSEEKFEFIRDRKFPYPPKRSRILGERVFTGSKVVVRSLVGKYPIAS